MAERREKTKEKMTRRRENKRMVFRKKVAIKLLIKRMTIEKVGNKNSEVAEANWPSPQGRE